MENKTKCLALIAILLALMAYSTASSISISGNTTNITTINNQTLGLQITVNNTNLAPTVAGETPGTGQRVQNVTYFNNNSDIELFVFAHAITVSSVAELHLFINGTKVLDTSGKPLAVAEQNNRSINAIIPRYSSYKVEIMDFHHYEWREYVILSGNVSMNITGTDNDSAYVNKSGDKITGIFYNTFGDIFNSFELTNGISSFNATNTTTGHSGNLDITPNEVDISVTDGVSNTLVITNTTTEIDMSGNPEYTFSSSQLDLHNNNLTNCGNCARLINDTIISSATNIINFTVPVNNKGYEMYIYLNNSNVGTADISMHINGDSTEANYTSQAFTVNGASSAASRTNTAHIMAASGSAEGFSTVKIQKTNLNTLVIHADGSRFIGSTSIILEKITVTKVAKISDITTISIVGSLANSIGAGSEFRIYKVD